MVREKIFNTKCHVCKEKKIISGTDKISLFVEIGIEDKHTIIISLSFNLILEIRGARDDREEMSPSNIVF